MRKIVCGSFGTIYDATLLKDNVMSSVNRRDVTDECVDAVRDHLMCQDGWDDKKFSGYTWNRSDKRGHLMLALFDDTKYKLTPIIDVESP